MAEHKFVYTVSGIELSEEKKAKISQAIAVAVAQEITGKAPEELRTDYLTLHRIYGGRMIPVVDSDVNFEALTTPKTE
jgi:hypothetical protein